MLDAENDPENTATQDTAAQDTAAHQDTGNETVTDTPLGIDPPLGAAPEPAATKPTAKRAAKKATATAAKKTAAKRATKKVTTAAAEEPLEGAAPADSAPADSAQEEPAAADPAPAKKAARKTAKKATAKKTSTARAAKTTASSPEAAVEPEEGGPEAGPSSEADSAADAAPPGTAATMLLFQAPDATTVPSRKKKTAAAKRETEAEQPQDEQAQAEKAQDQPARGKKAAKQPAKKQQEEKPQETPAEGGQDQDRGETDSGEAEGETGARRRRRRGGRRRRKGGDEDGAEGAESTATGEEEPESPAGKESDAGESSTGTRRRRRRRRAGEDSDGSPDDPENTVTRVRKARSAEDEITSVTGSTRLEAKKQRRREGREAGRRRAPIVSEAEFLARREAVDRVMVIRQKKDLTQIAVLEDKVLVEHYVARESQTSLIGNVYLGRVQNVLPSMEAAFIDIGKGRNAVLYAGEVNWDALGAKDGGQRKIEQVLKSGQSVLVQVTKDPIGHKGARLTSQISLPGRFLVYVPDGTTSGISRKLPDTERNRLKTLLKEIVPDTAGVIVRTAAEGASEQELTRDVERLTARWEDIQGKVKGGNAPQLLYGEPDLTLKVVRDLFTEDFGKLVVSGDEAWDMVDGYVEHVAPDLAERLERYDGGEDVFAAYRIDEQIAKGLDRKVWLPSGGSLIIDRTEAMTVIDVNTGKFTGSGGNLEETVTKNNLEAAEEIVRQLRLRDIGGIIVVDFIDMVLESNRDLVLRRMVECLGRDRTRHQVAEVTSLGLVQMTRKRIGTGLLEAFSESCEHCQGRGVIVHHEPIEPKKKQQDEEPRRSRRGRGRGRSEDSAGGDNRGGNGGSQPPSPKDVAEMAKAEPARSSGPDGEQPRAEDEHARAQQPEKPESQAGLVSEDAEAQAGRASGHAEKPARQARRRGQKAERQPEAKPDAAEPDAGTEARVAPDTTAPPAETTPPPAAAPEPSPAEAAADEKPATEPVAREAATGPVAREAATEPVSGEAAAEPAAPRIVTSVRRRGVRRPAGPPGGASAPGDHASDVTSTGNGVAADGAPSDPAADDDSQHPAATAHVPVKKKGSRSR